MRNIAISDVTLKTVGATLSFRQKLELAKSLDRVGLTVVETSPISDGQKDILLVKSLASVLQQAVLCVPVGDDIDATWSAVQDAAHPRLQVSVPVSTVRMEYVCHMKPDAVLHMISERVKACAERCPDVEFVAEDFARADHTFLLQAVAAATANGATTVTLYDSAGVSLDYDYLRATRRMRNHLPSGVRLGAWCSNRLFTADCCAFAAVCAGADEVKTSPYGNEVTSLKRFARLIEEKQEVAGVSLSLKTTELPRTTQQIKSIADITPLPTPTPETSLDPLHNPPTLTIDDDKATVVKMLAQMGYDLDDEDEQRVFDAFLLQVGKTGSVSAKELDAIARTAAFQAPAIYKLESYLITSGRGITSTCHIRLRKHEEPTALEGVCMGDGPVDAAFRAIESLVGTRYELDDFQLQSVTQGSKALGGAIVSLRHDGRLYAGRGVSTDIVEAGIMAYLNALNKILFEA